MLHETSMRLIRTPSTPRGTSWLTFALGVVPETWTPYLLNAAA
jgi:hypothetical protein